MTEQVAPQGAFGVCNRHRLAVAHVAMPCAIHPFSRDIAR